MGMHRIKPVISTTAVTCGTTAGSSAITSSAGFGSVTVGMRIVGAGIPFNSVVGEVTDTSNISIINAETKLPAPATATSASVSLRFGYFTSAAYSSGDALGFPFRVDLNLVWNAIIIDAAKQITKAKLYFFTGPFVESADNAAFNPSDADASKLCGYIAIATSVVLTSNHIVTQGNTALPVHLGTGPVWCQLVVDTDTPTFLAVDDLTVVLTGE